MDARPTRDGIVQRIEQALRRMPVRQREIFLAARIDDLSCAEIAARTGLSVRTVERAFAAALQTIHDALEDCRGVFGPHRCQADEP